MNTLWAIMNDPGRATLWAALQAELLILSAVLVAWYLYETRKMRQAAEDQVRESQALERASQEQLEAQFRPAIAVFYRGNVILSPAERGSIGKPDLDRLQDDIPFIEAGEEVGTSIRPRDIGMPGVPVLNGRSLQCQYKSLSGRTYWTVVDFDKPSGMTVIDTPFLCRASAGSGSGSGNKKPRVSRLLRNTGLGGKQMRRCPRGSEGIFHGFHSRRRSESGDVVSGECLPGD
jgi:hypothetical protein